MRDSMIEFNESVLSFFFYPSLKRVGVTSKSDLALSQEHRLWEKDGSFGQADLSSFNFVFVKNILLFVAGLNL